MIKGFSLPFLKTKKEEVVDTPAGIPRKKKKSSDLFAGKEEVFFKIKKVFQEKRLYVMVAIIILILSGTVFRQLILRTIQLNVTNKEKRGKLAVLTEKVNYLQDLEPNQLEKTILELERVFPSKKPALELVNSLKALAIENKVMLGKLSLSPGKIEPKSELETKDLGGVADKGKMKGFNLDFRVSGKSNNVSQFIKDLQRTAPLTKIDSLGLSTSEVGGEMVSNVTLIVSVFYQALPESIPPIEAPIAHLTVEEEEVLGQLSGFKFYHLREFSGATKGKANLFEKSL